VAVVSIARTSSDERASERERCLRGRSRANPWCVRDSPRTVPLIIPKLPFQEDFLKGARGPLLFKNAFASTPLATAQTRHTRAPPLTLTCRFLVAGGQRRRGDERVRQRRIQVRDDAPNFSQQKRNKNYNKSASSSLSHRSPLERLLVSVPHSRTQPLYRLKLPAPRGANVLVL
jgi:hypothetical protein